MRLPRCDDLIPRRTPKPALEPSLFIRADIPLIVFSSLHLSSRPLALVLSGGGPMWVCLWDGGERKGKLTWTEMWFQADSSSSSLFASFPLSPCDRSIFLSPSLTSLLLLSPSCQCQLRIFSASPSLILQGSHSGSRADLYKSPTEIDRGKERERKKER